MNPLPLSDRIEIGFITSVSGPAAAKRTAEQAEAWGYDSVMTGDHVAFAVPILDPFLQLAQLACFSDKLTLGTSVYLLPLRHPVPVAKQVATLERACGGRLIFGVGVGGEFPNEYAACGVPLEERGARLSEAIPLLRQLWSGEETESDGRFYPIPKTRMLPKTIRPGGPAIWAGGRSPGALRRVGRMCDGWISYVVTPEQYGEALGTIAKEAEAVSRTIDRFETSHLLFTFMDDSYEAAWDAATEHLSTRYAMDFRRAAQRYAALGRPEDVAERVQAYLDAGLRHIVVDVVGPPGATDEQRERFAKEVRPLLRIPGDAK
jgi:probable F420-dependent oxidoreductase